MPGVVYFSCIETWETHHPGRVYWPCKAWFTSHLLHEDVTEECVDLPNTRLELRKQTAEGSLAGLQFVFYLGFHHKISLNKVFLIKKSSGTHWTTLRPESSCKEYAVSCKISVMLQPKGIEPRMGFILGFPWDMGLARFNAAPFRHKTPPFPLQLSPAPSSVRQETAAHHPVFSILSSLCNLSSPPFSNFCAYLKWNLKISAKGLMIYIILCIGAARKSASSKVLTVLCPITVRIKNKSLK